MIYVIDSIREKSGKPHEREGRRKGHRVEITDVSLGIPLVARYIDEDTAYLQTSKVEAYNAEWETSNHLTVQTRNSVYTFRKEAI